MNILITAGGTSEKIDDVRRIVNTATGRLGALIADEFINKTGAAVTFVCDEASAVPASGADIIKIRSVDDLLNNICELLAHNKFDAVIHSMAVSDYKMGGVMSLDDLIMRAIELGEAEGEIDKDKFADIMARGKKISSDIDGMLMLMEKTPKVISVIKKLQPETILVGFKLLAGVSEEELLRVGYELLLKNDCDFVFSNDLEQISADSHKGILIEPDRSYRRMSSKPEIAEAIVQKIAALKGEHVGFPAKIGFIGAGKIGFTLGRYFMKYGLNVTGYYSRSLSSAREAAEFTGTACYETVGQVVSASDIIFLTVPDSEIKSVWDILKSMPVSEAGLENKTICHCSGALSSEVFEGIEERGAYGCSLHPFFAASSKRESYKEIMKACFALEGDARDMRNLTARLGNAVYVITAEQKVKYHAAAVFLSNHVVAAAHAGGKLLKECGFDDLFVETALQTLFIGNCRKIAELGTAAALTGPVERNDAATVRKHIDCLAGAGDTRRLYALLSAQLMEIAKEKHSGAQRDWGEMEAVIKSGL